MSTPQLCGNQFAVFWPKSRTHTETAYAIHRKLVLLQDAYLCEQLLLEYMQTHVYYNV